MIARLVYWLTGGRPMIDQGYAFADHVTGQDVRYWRDRFGREWMAVTAWASFRVPRSASALDVRSRREDVVVPPRPMSETLAVCPFGCGRQHTADEVPGACVQARHEKAGEEYRRKVCEREGVEFVPKPASLSLVPAIPDSSDRDLQLSKSPRIQGWTVNEWTKFVEAHPDCTLPGGVGGAIVAELERQLAEAREIATKYEDRYFTVKAELDALTGPGKINVDLLAGPNAPAR